MDKGKLLRMASDRARELGHNIQLNRDKGGHFLPLFRYRATGRCMTCGAELVVDTSPAQMGCSWPWNEDKANAWAWITGAAFDERCQQVRPRGKRKDYFLRRAMSR